MGRRPSVCFLALVLVCLGCCLDLGIAAKNETVCKNVDIRNTVQNFRKVENCTVIEGYLQILLIDNGQAHDYEGLLFPKLVEITGYLLLYRAFGMNSFGRIFPNLAVIRGNVLFHNYALVIFEMYHLQEIGLHHLTDILRGSVRIEKNPGLCYVDTVDWDLIAKEGRGGHFFKHNKKKDECPNVCPTNMCPNTTRDGKLTSLCWNSQHCQKVCPVTCEKNAACNDKGECCQQECLGGCSGPTAYDCVACKHVLFEGKCLKKCPPGTFELIGRRCVQELVCRAFEEKDSNNNKIYWKPFNGQCITQCPPGYIEDENDKHLCKQCAGKCPKTCKGMVVDHVNAAQKFRGCTIINGSLEIHIRGGSNVIKELEESMSLVQEIHGYLKIARSFPLVSLNFLKSLRIIHGDQLDKKNYAFLVLDNQNLQELWDWESRKDRLEIRKGKIFFHFNSKLCISKIEELKKYADVQDWDDRDVSPSSNGDRVACDVTNMNVTVIGIGARAARIRFDSFQKYLHDERSLLGYVIYYREAPYKNITIFEGRDACGSDVWTVRDVEVSDLTDSYITHKIQDLKPFTQYALYIRTYTTASGRQGAQSNIIYFKTEPDTPSPPMNIKARSTLHGEIVISWDPPKRPNGNVTHYIVEGSNEEDLSGLINQRNYCSEPIAYSDYKRTYNDNYDESNVYKHVSLHDYLNTTTSEYTDEDDEECCSCSKDSHSVNYDDDEAEFQIHFEDFLQNTVYIKNPNIHRRKRTVNFPPDKKGALLADHDEGSLNTLPLAHSIEGDKYVGNYLYQFKRLVYHRPFLVVSNLKHFTEYTVEIRACQDRQAGFQADFCSLRAITSVRTLALEGADDIRSSSLHIQTENMTAAYSAFVKWEEPKDPNGIIVAYILEYHRLDADHYKPNRICITRANYLQHNGYYISELPPGNYSLRVKANSLAKYGNWTSLVYFKIVAVSEYSTWVTVAILVGIIASVIAFGLLFMFFYKIKRRIPNYVDYASVNPEYISSNLVYEPDEWEIPREKVKLLEELGQGSFGMVYKGEVHDLNGMPFVPCAAKTVNESATLRERIEFLQEASVMKTFVDCEHVVKLLGVVSKGQPTLVIMELMPNGDLKTYLRSHRPDSEDNPGAQPPTLKQILQMAGEIADGLAYLSAKKFVHRDLAARNCMVAEDMTVKIGDFGMTRDVYETDYYRKGGKGLLPVRWMAPESLQDGIFDCQSDVWSYGVVLWEMATLASQPYQGLSNEEVLKYVIAGNTMARPEDCPESLYVIMEMCWHRNPKARPTFIEIIEMLLPELNQKFHQVSFYHTQHLPNSPDHNDADTLPTTPLRSPTRDEDNDQSVYRYFPSATQIPEENFNFTFDNGDAIASTSNYRAEASNSNEGSKGVSVNYSDGSKGSKISNNSNGSIPNGHVHLTLGRASEC